MTAVNMTRTWRTRKSLALAGYVTSYFVHDGEPASGWTSLRFPDNEPACQVRHDVVMKAGQGSFATASYTLMLQQAAIDELSPELTVLGPPT